MKRWICRVLRSLLFRLEGLESDDELRARTMNVIRRGAIGGSRDDIEGAIVSVTPATLAPEFYWDSPLMKGDRLKLTVIWR